MIIDTHHRTDLRSPADPDVTRLLWEDAGAYCLDEAFDDDDDEIVRMIQLSGMIGIDCGVLQDE